MNDAGYLIDPERHKLVTTDAVSWEQLQPARCLILLGEPGIGKSTVLEQAGELQPDQHKLFLNLRGYSDQQLLSEKLFGSAPFTAWLKGDWELDLTLDSLDECLIHIKTVAAWLVDELRRCPIERLRLRIACRTAEWPTFLDSAFRELWGTAEGDVCGYELTVLREEDVRTAALVELGGDREAGAFLQTIEARSAVPLAINPNTLKFLIAEYKDTGTLPASSVDLYHRGCRRLAVEHEGSSRRASGATSKLPPDDILSVAERIAAACLFGRKASLVYSAADVARTDELQVSHLVGRDIINGAVANVTIEMLRDTALSALFSGRAEGTVGFAHWTYGEFLAARFCVTRNLSLEQIGDLLFHPDSGARPQVVPQLSEVAAWLATMRPDVMSRIKDADPKVLLRSTVTTLSNELRMQTTTTILEMAERGELFDYEDGFRQPKYAVLHHPGLHHQLEPIIRDRDKPGVARRIAIDIAEACRVASLVPALFDVLSDGRDDRFAREQAAHAIFQVTDREADERWLPLLDASQAEDPNEQLKGYAVRALWPQRLTAEELFSRLAPPRRSYYSGAYALFVGWELAPTLRASDLPAALRWVLAMPERNHAWHDAQNLSREILYRALDHLGNSAIADLMVSAILDRWSKYEEAFPRGPHNDVDPLSGKPEARRQLVAALIARIVGDEVRWLLPLRNDALVKPDDLPWLITQSESATTFSEAARWAKVIHVVFSHDVPGHLDLVIDACERIPALQLEIGDRLKPISICSEEADRQRAVWAENLRHTQRPSPPKVTHAPATQMALEKLGQFDAGVTDAWWQLQLLLTLARDSDQCEDRCDYEPDMATFPGWADLDVELQRRCVATAREYVRIGDPQTTSWLGKSIVHRPARAGYRSVRLLLDRDPAALDGLSREEWERWAPTVVSFEHFSSGDEKVEHKELIRRAYRHAPEVVLSTLKCIVEQQRKQTGRLWTLSDLETALDDRMAMFLLHEVLSDDSMPAQLVGDVFEFLLSHRCSIAIEFALDLVEQYKCGTTPRDKAVVVAVNLLNAVPVESWAQLWPLIEGDGAFGEEVIARLAEQHQQLHSGKIALLLNEQQVAELYRWTFLHFPPQTDPDLEGIHAVGRREAVAEFRERLLARLRDRATKTAVSELRRLSTVIPNGGWLIQVALIAERNRLRAAWPGVPIPTILAVARDRHARPIESAPQLLATIMTSLKKLEGKLHGLTPAVVDLWDKDRPKDERAFSDRIARHLDDDLREVGIVANREAEVRRGQETDILVDMVVRGPLNGRAERISVVIEVKGCWHDDVKTAMETQLVNRYLRGTSSACGLFLVGWFQCDAWDRTDGRKSRHASWSLQAARTELADQARVLSLSGVTVESFVIDAALRKS